MTAHSNLALCLSIFGMVVGFVLLFWVSLRKARDPHEFRLGRMLGMLFRCLLSPSPIYFLALRVYPERPQLSFVLAAGSFVLCPFCLHMVLFVLKLFGRDVRQH